MWERWKIGVCFRVSVVWCVWCLGLFRIWYSVVLSLLFGMMLLNCLLSSTKRVFGLLDVTIGVLFESVFVYGMSKFL